MSRKRGPSAERGMSLVEHLVAVALFALVLLLALSQLDAARRAIKLGGNHAELQQSLRAGADQMLRDLRMAGFDVPPEEAIVRADPTALAIRVGARSGQNGERTENEAGIVGYALAKPGSHVGDELELNLGDGRFVSVPGLALTHDSPPYTLYRLTLRSAANGPRVVRTPLIDHVRSLRFRYGDGDDGEETSDASIRQIRVVLTGQTRDPDIDWIDTSDPLPASRHSRKRRLTFDVRPRNLGLPRWTAE